MPQRRLLIVNADDFGLSPGVNAAIIATHRGGIVTSASLMVRYAAAAEAVQLARENPRLSVGLHVDLGEWHYVADHWETLYDVVALDDADAVRGEVQRQLETFCEMCGRPPSHIDSHQHVHRDEPIRSAVLEAATALGIPVRHYTPDVCYRGDFYGQSNHGEPWLEGVNVSALTRLIADLPAGVTEVGCHPGWDDDLKTMYRLERRIEAATLCDPLVRQAVDDHAVELISFKELKQLIKTDFR